MKFDSKYDHIAQELRNQREIVESSHTHIKEVIERQTLLAHSIDFQNKCAKDGFHKINEQFKALEDLGKNMAS